MITLCLAATKGGVGKTTLAAAIAVAATRRNRVAATDLDAQQSLARWHAHRAAETGDDCRPALLPLGAYPDAAIEEARKSGRYDWLVIDTPPGNLRHTTAGVIAADLVLIPVRPSPIDVEALGALVELCRRHRRDFAFVLNGVQGNNKDARGLAAGARAYLSALGDVLDVEVALRTTYASAMVGGGVGPERDPAAKAEVAALLRAIEQRVAATHKKGGAR